MAVVVAANAVFFTGDPKTTYASVIATSASYTANKQIVLPIRSNIWLKNNSWNLIGDWRYMKYPQSTYGLGGATEKTDANLIDYSYIRFYQSALKNVYSKLYVGGGVNFDYFYNVQEHWSGTGPSDFETYGVGTGSSSISDGLNIQCLWDNRKNTINPEKGGYVNFVYRFYPTFMGNTTSWGSTGEHHKALLLTCCYQATAGTRIPTPHVGMYKEDSEALTCCIQKWNTAIELHATACWVELFL